MALRGKKPTTIEKRLKAFFYGAAGVGKTTAAIQFPRPYLIDTERGAENDQYVELLDKAGGAIFQTTSFEELLNEVKSLLTENHGFKTLVIDPLTTLYNDLLDKAEKLVGNEYGKHYGEANKQMKHLINLLNRLDMNVIITSHARNEYGDNLKVIGTTFDCYKKLDYLFDLVIEIQKRGKSRYGLVKKTRIKNFEEGEQFPFNYDVIADKYGREILERDAIAQVLATVEQVSELKRLFDLLKVSGDYIEKMLTKAESSTLDELPQDKAQAWIDSLLKKINPEAA